MTARQERRRGPLTAPRVRNVRRITSLAQKAQTPSSSLSSEAGAMFGGAPSAMRSSSLRSDIHPLFHIRRRDL